MNTVRLSYRNPLGIQPVRDEPVGQFASERADMLALADWLDGLASSRSNPAAYRARAARLRRLAAELGEGR